MTLRQSQRNLTKHSRHGRLRVIPGKAKGGVHCGAVAQFALATAVSSPTGTSGWPVPGHVPDRELNSGQRRATAGVRATLLEYRLNILGRSSLG